MKLLKQKWKEILEVIGIFLGVYLIYVFFSHFQMNCPEEPYDVWLKDGNVYVVMEKGDNILQYSFDGELELTLGPNIIQKKEFQSPYSQRK